MLPFHRRLAQIGLAAVSEFGFVLAGGYAISANGMGDRPSEDVDLFTNNPDPDDFAAAVQRLRSAYQANGLHVEDIRIRPNFADFLGQGARRATTSRASTCSPRCACAPTCRHNTPSRPRSVAIRVLTIWSGMVVDYVASATSRMS